jgi:hypothetical protein
VIAGWVVEKDIVATVADGNVDAKVRICLPQPFNFAFKLCNFDLDAMPTVRRRTDWTGITADSTDYTGLYCA